MENDGKWWKYLFGILGSKSKTQRNTDEICTLASLASSCFGWPHLNYVLMCTSRLRSLQSDPGSSEAKKHTVRFFLHTLGQMFYPGVGLPDTASSHCRIWQNFSVRDSNVKIVSSIAGRSFDGAFRSIICPTHGLLTLAKTAKTLVISCAKLCEIVQWISAWCDSMSPFQSYSSYTSRGAIRTWFGAMKDSVKPNIGGMVVLQNATKILYHLIPDALWYLHKQTTAIRIGIVIEMGLLRGLCLDHGYGAGVVSQGCS